MRGGTHQGAEGLANNAQNATTKTDAEIVLFCSVNITPIFERLPLNYRTSVALTAEVGLAATRIAAFLTCRMMYRYEYIDKIGRFFHRSSPGMSMGAIIHQALFHYHTAGGALAEDADSLVERSRLAWRSHGFSDAAEEADYRAQAFDMLRAYHEAEAARTGERRLFLAEKSLKLDMGSFILTGRVDRIDEHFPDGNLEIIDYKSGRNDVTEDQVRNAIAMTVYQLMARRMWPDRRITATIHALRGDKSATIELTDDELAIWEDNLRGIGQGDHQKPTTEAVRPIYIDGTCETCDFYRRCGMYFEQHDAALEDAD